MKGLLVKDFRLLRGQKRFFVSIVLIGSGFLVFYGNPDFAISYVAILFAMYTISSISYDKYNNGWSFLFALPVSRKSYVREKYVFGACMLLLALSVISVMAWVSVLLKHMEYSVGEWGMTVAASIFITTFCLGLSIPIQLKFEADKGRIVMLMSLGILFLAAYIVTKIYFRSGGSSDDILRVIFEQGKVKLVFIGILAMLLITAVSYLISLRIMEKKEF